MILNLCEICGKPEMTRNKYNEIRENQRALACLTPKNYRVDSLWHYDFCLGDHITGLEFLEKKKGLNLDG